MPATRIYTTRTFLEADGFDFTGFTDTQIWRMIRKVAGRIDTFTRQWFNGEFGEYAMDGRISVLLEHRARLPFISVSKIETVGNRINNNEAPTTARLQPYYLYDYYGYETMAAVSTARSVVNSESYVVQNRLIRRTCGFWPGGELPVVVTGALGRVEANKSVVTTTLTEVTNASTTVGVDDVTGFRVRDVIDIVGEFEFMRVMVIAVDRLAKTLTFDVLPELGESIPVGAAISTYGAVPCAIEEVAHFLFLDQLAERAINAAGDGSGSGAAVLQLKSETVDDYKWEYFNPSDTATTFASGSLLTGSPQMDMILSEYSMPGSARLL